MGDFSYSGVAVVPDVLDSAEVAALIEVVCGLDAGDGVRTRNGVYAVRNLLEASAEIRELAVCEKLRKLLDANLGGGAFPVRGTLFDKTAGANWLVPWHQDLTTCVTQRREVEGYGPWTVKAGIPHVQPPVRVLEQMLSIRIHLDDCDADNGALRVLPGTHRMGRLMADRIAELQNSVTPVTCEVKAGGAVLMRPLVLHASSAATKAAHRRVIHIDYAATKLDGGLAWR